MYSEKKICQFYEETAYTLKKEIKKTKGRKIFIWPANIVGEMASKILKEMDIEFEGYIDSDASKSGQIFCGKEIFTPDKMANKSDEYFIVIASSFYKSIKNQLFTMGYTEMDMCGTIEAPYKPIVISSFASLEITERCNLKCHFCIAGSNTFKSTNADMPKETVKKIIDSIVEGGIEKFNLTGNSENTLHKDYIEIFNYAASRFNHIVFATNGHTLKKEIRDAILSKEHKSKITVQFSITGFDAEVYNEFQGSGQQDKSDKLRNNVYKIICDFAEEIKVKNSDVKIELRYLLQDNNLEDFKKYVDFWEDKVDIITAYLLIGLEGPVSQGVVKKTHLKRCHHIGHLQIRLDGTTYACCAGRLMGGPILGNVNEMSISEMFNSDGYAKLYDSMTTLDFENLPEECKNCVYLFYNSFAYGVDYLRARKFDNCFNGLARLVNEKPILFFFLDQGVDELFYFMYVNKKLDEFDISIADPYEKGYYERFEIQQPSVELFKDKFVICFNDYELNRLAPEIKEAAYKMVSVSDILEGNFL